ncbi:MAG TPA: tetratricopeptide repeat protein [Pirellulaceae bacterium]|nr:tetratricopeptide repeat protein [Pirellulaceae bacterium]
MNLISRLTGMFSRGGRDEERLRQAMEHAKANRPERAMQIYNSLVASTTTDREVRAKALFNRALAHSSLKEDQRALEDLSRVLALPNVPDSVTTAARSQLARVRKRSERRA